MKTFVAVAGGANIDIGGMSYAPFLSHESNPGRVTMTPGGVARNIAHNLALLDIPVKLFTAVGDDMQGNLILQSARKLQMDEEIVVMRDKTTSSYLYVAGPDGDMTGAVSDMDICDEMTPAFFEARLSLINEASLLVADANLPEESLVFLAEHIRVPLFIDPVSVIKSVRLSRVLSRIHTLKPNRAEAERLSGMSVTNRDAAEAAAEKLLAAGVRRVFITLGAGGVLAADGTECLFSEPLPGNAKGFTGAGDAFMAGLVCAYLQGVSLRETVNTALAATSVATESAETINARLSRSALEEKLRMNAL